MLAHVSQLQRGTRVRRVRVPAVEANPLDRFEGLIQSWGLTGEDARALRRLAIEQDRVIRHLAGQFPVPLAVMEEEIARARACTPGETHA